MTKRNLTLGSASGKLGSVVYMRRRGQQIARLLVPSPRDPRSLAQCVVRARFANYVSLWRLLRPFVGSSWRGVSRYGSTENAFYKHNTRLMPTASAEMSRNAYAFPCLGLVTYGSLPVSYQYDYQTLRIPSGSLDVSAAFYPYAGNNTRPSTIGELSSIMLGWGVGLERGDVLHFLCYAFAYDPNNFAPAGAMDAPPRVWHASITIDEADDTQLLSALPFVNFVLGNGGRLGNLLGFAAGSVVSLGDPADITTGIALASWVERPRNPQFSRNCRSVFVMPDNLRTFLTAASMSGNIADMYAATFQQV